MTVIQQKESVVRKPLTKEQVMRLIAGKDFWRSAEIPDLQIGSLKFTDGPNGARGSEWTEGKAASCFPCATAIGATFDRYLACEVGKAIAQDAIEKNATGLLAPTMNIHRYLLNGRNFESYSEDPLLSGYLAAAYIRGVQSQNVAACPKHFIANEAENGRRWSNSVISQRALHEIYLEPFRIAIKESDPWMIMTAYNSCNGEFCSESKALLDILRKDWKYDGLIISDWFGTYSTAKAINAGLDLEMPGPSKFRTPQQLEKHLASQTIEWNSIHASAERLCTILDKTNRLGISDPGDLEGNLPENDIEVSTSRMALLRRTAADSMVLLKNQSDALPLPLSSQRVGIIGSLADQPSIHGGGSASLASAYLRTPAEELCNAFPNATFSTGVRVERLVDLASLLVPAGHQISLEWFNGPSVCEEMVFQTEVLRTSEYMLVEHYPVGLTDTGNFCTKMTMTIIPQESGYYDLSLTGVGNQTCFLDGVEIFHVRRDENLASEDFLFNRAKLESLHRLPHPLEAFRDYHLEVHSSSSSQSPQHVNREFYIQGCRVGLSLRSDDQVAIEHARTIAAASETNIVFVGTTTQWESEGFDRVSFQLPNQQDRLIKEVTNASKGKVIVIINSGSPIEMNNWIDDVDAVLQVWFPGQEYGTALLDILTGLVSPSARLPTTIPRSLEESPAGDIRSITDGSTANMEIAYNEDIFVGYRGYSSPGPCTTFLYNPLFHFGHGLSYSTFRYKLKFVTSMARSKQDPHFKIGVEICNTGNFQSAEVAQLYVHAIDSIVSRPQFELRAFAKTQRLPPSSTQLIELDILKEAFSYWDVKEQAWRVDSGAYKCCFAGSQGVGNWLEDTHFDVHIENGFHWKGL